VKEGGLPPVVAFSVPKPKLGADDVELELVNPAKLLNTPVYKYTYKYTADLLQLVIHHRLHPHAYADDTQIYGS